jgi:thiamine transport system permease protein
MAGGARPMMVDGGIARRRMAAGIAAITCLVVLAGSAIVATLLAGLDADVASALEAVSGAAYFTVKQALFSTLLSVGFAVPVAIALQSLPGFPGRRLVLALFAMPLSLPAIAAVLGVLSLLGRSGWVADLAAALGTAFRPDIYGLDGIVLVHVFFNMPLAVRMLTSAFDEIPQEQFKLAETLRFGVMARLTHVLIPAMRNVLPGIVGLVFLLCAGSYTIVLTLGGGPAATTLQVAIQQALSMDFNPGRAALLTLAQLALTLLVLASLPSAPKQALAQGSSEARRWHQPNAWEAAASVLAIALACLFTGLPLIALGAAGFPADHFGILGSEAFWQAIATSATIALASALLAVGAAVAIAAATYALQDQGRGIWWVERSMLAALGIPPLILGVGWFILLAMLGQPFALAPVLIVLANAIMALPFALQLIRPAIDRHFSQTDRLAAAVRIAGWRRIAAIDMPALKPALISSLFFAGALSFGDLGVVTLYGSDHLTTLPALIYRSMGSYRTNDASGLVLYLVVITGTLAYLSLRNARHAG